jgi:hypothetical protein
MRERGVRGVMLGRVNDAIAALGCWDMLEGWLGRGLLCFSRSLSTHWAEDLSATVDACCQGHCVIAQRTLRNLFDARPFVL